MMYRLALVLCGLALLAGCTPPSTPTTWPSAMSNTTAMPAPVIPPPTAAAPTGEEPKTDAEDTTPVAEQAAEKGGIRLNVANWDETLKKVAKHKGKVVVLDLWSSWCAPCKKEFPNLVALQKKHPEKVVCMSLNIDFTGLEGETPESHREEVLGFLREVDAQFENLICSTPDEKLLSDIKLDAVPAVYVFNRDGEIAKRFDNTTGNGKEFTYAEHINPLVEELLAK